MYRFGVDTIIWTPRFTRRDVWTISRARELGFQTVDIDTWDPDTFPAAEVRREAEKAGIEVVTCFALGEENNTLSPDPSVRRKGIELLKKAVDVNIEIGSKIMGGIPYGAWGYRTGRPRTEQEWNQSVEAVREVADYAKKEEGLVLAIEVVNRFETHFINTAEDAVRYCRAVGTGNLKVHLDTYHMIQEEQSFTEALSVCGSEYLGYIHIGENHRGIPGTGMVPWEEFFTALIGIGYDGPVSIEAFDPNYTGYDNLCAVWRKLAGSGEEIAVRGLENLAAIARKIGGGSTASGKK
jgi:D-psicose/D-tagatose/L-ribulose 3-epimerase